jgi:hypothetical protein
VVFPTARPRGDNKQHLCLVMHVFTTEQLGDALNGELLCDQQYGNDSSLGSSHAISSETMTKVS